MSWIAWKKMMVGVGFLWCCGATAWAVEPSTSETRSPTNISGLDLSFILDLTYLHRQIEEEPSHKTNSIYATLEQPGLKGGPLHEHSLKNGFNLGHAELTIAAAVDPYFDLFAALHLGEDEFEIAEVYATTRRLPYGLQVKLGKFLSAFGRINGMHEHAWDFYEAPLITKLMWGGHGLAETGAQVQWLVPSVHYILLGMEWLRGENQASFGTQGFQVGTQQILETSQPGLGVGYVKTSFDLGRASVLAGLSQAAGKTRIAPETEETATHSHTHRKLSFDLTEEYLALPLAGDTLVQGADITFKYPLDSYRMWSVQSEYLQRLTEGQAYQESGSLEVEREHAGWYMQTLLKFSERWRCGLRYDALTRNTWKFEGDSANLPRNFSRHSFVMDYFGTEFSRIRLQYNQDDSRYLAHKRQEVREIVLNFNFSIGAHGAHPF